MAGQPPRTIRQRKAELISYLNSARTVLSVDGPRVGRQARRKANVPARVGDSIRGHAWAWVGGAFGLGLAVGLLRRPGGKRRKQRNSRQEEENETPKKPVLYSVLGALATTAVSIARPTLITMARRKLEKFVQHRLHPGD